MPKWRTRIVSELIAEHGASCRWCGRAVSQGLPDGHPAKATLEHVVATANGGAHDKANLAIACLTCNRAKADKSVAEFAAARMAQKAAKARPARAKFRKGPIATPEHRSAWKRQILQGEG